MAQGVQQINQGGMRAMAAPSSTQTQASAGRRPAGLRSRLRAMVLLAVATLMLVVTLSAYMAHRSSGYAQDVFVAKDVTADILPPPMYLIEMRLLLSRAVEGTMTLPIARQEFDRLAQEYLARYEYWRSHPPGDLGSLLLGDQHRSAVAFRDHVEQQLALLAQDPEAARAQLPKVQAAYEQHRQAVDRTVAASLERASGAQSTFDDSLEQGWKVQLGIALLAGALYAVFGSQVGRSVWRSIGGEPSQAAALARAVSEGELRHDVTVREGDTTSVVATMGEMCRSLSSVASRVRGSAVAIASSSREIAAGNHDLSERTQKQASALQATASAVEQLSSTVTSNAENAGVANDLAREATEMAYRGGEEVRQVVATMGEIQASSQRIGEIVGIIDGIAFQTNILALNASVEAARAGESGRGFAVVAAEVRNLAGKSAEAAREIKSLVSASVERSEAGTALVHRAGDTVTNVVQAIERVSTAVHEITAASREQSEGLKLVAQSVHEMDHATQGNAALVEEAAAAAESLKQEAALLVEAMAVFKTRA